MDRLAVWDQLATVHAAVAEALAARLEAEADLQLTEFLVLRRIAGAPDQRLRMSELAARTPLTKSGLTRLVDRLVDDGLLERRSCPSDRRGWFAVLTTAGAAALDRARKVHEDTVLHEFGDRLDESEGLALGAVLDRLLGAVPDPPPPCG